MRRFSLVAMAVMLGVLSGCGSSGNPNDQAAPVANAGADQSVAIGSTVTLDGSGSSDPNGDSLTYVWSFTSRPSLSSAVLSDATSSHPTFVADLDGSYVVSLTVNDGTADSAADMVTITASVDNAAPIADAGPDQSVTTGATVTLDGSQSSDANGDSLTYAWSFTSLPPLSTAVLSDAASSHPTFTADVDGSYVLSLTANDGIVDSATDAVVVTAAPAAPAGTLDATFNSTGTVTTLVDGRYDQRGVAIQADGKILAAGSREDGSGNYEFAVVRYSSNGAQDTSFDTDGVVTTAAGTYSYARNVAVQSDGKILVSGDSCDDSPGVVCSFAVARYNTDGSLDSSFGTSGIAKAKVAANVTDWAFAMALQADGKIVLAGTTRDSNYTSINLVRFNTNGSGDSGFGSAGTVTTVLFSGYNSAAYGVAIQSDGKIVAVGKAENDVTHDSDFAILRYDTNGSLDTSFDGDGVVLTDVGGLTNNDEAYAVAIQPVDGKIVVAGFANNGSNNDMAIARYNTDGSPDTSFGADGKVMTPIGTAAEIIRGLAIQSNGKLVGVGGSHNGSNMDFAIVRYAADGSLDTAFGDDGVSTLALGTDFDTAFGVALQPADGKIVVSGTTTPNGGDYYFGLARYNP